MLHYDIARANRCDGGLARSWLAATVLTQVTEVVCNMMASRAVYEDMSGPISCCLNMVV